MTVHHGKDGVVKVGAVTVKTQKWSLNEEIAISDSTSQGDDYESHLTGQKKATGSIDCLLDDADAGQTLLTLGASITLNLYPDGASSGARKWSATATITSPVTNSDKSNNNMRTFSFTANGEFSWSTVS